MEPAAPSVPIVPTDEEIAAFVGRGHRLYREFWRPALNGGRIWCGFNFSAALFTVTWFVYRRMYREALTAFVPLFFVAILLDPRVMGSHRMPSPTFLATVWCFGIGLAANGLYLQRLREILEKAPPSDDPSTRLGWLARKGGTQPVLAIVLWLAQVIGKLLESS